MNRKKSYLAIVACLSCGAETVFARESHELLLNHINGNNGFKIRGLGGPDDYVNVGRSVKTIDDINGDQITDLLVGTRTSTSYVLFGHPAGIPHPFDLTTIDGSNGFSVQSQSDIESYSTITALGDVNNDGINDFSAVNDFNDIKVVFGQANYPSGQIDLGLVQPPDVMTLLRGSPDGLRGPLDKLGDINGDGFEDFSVSDPSYGELIYNCDPYYPSGTRSAKGASYLIFGSDGPTPGAIDLDQLDQALPANAVRIVGRGNPGGIGEGVKQSTALGDVNGDGIDDLAVNSSGNCVCNCYYRSGSDTYIVFGQEELAGFPTSTVLDPEQGFRLSTRAPRGRGIYGSYPLRVGDINHDGIDDIGYCFLYNETVDVRRCGVIFGDTKLGAGDGTPPDGTNGFEIHLEERLASLAFIDSGLAPGDFNGDGVDDLFLIRRGQYCGFDCQPTSSAMVFWGSDQPFQSVYWYHSLNVDRHIKVKPATNIITYASTAGDINQDGFSDLAIGLHDSFDGKGTAYVIYGFKDMIFSDGFD